MAEAGAVIGCKSVDQWTQQLEQAKQTKQLVVVDFTATWCGPCRRIAPIFDELAKKFHNVVFLKVDLDELESVANDWAINSAPTFIFLKEGTIVDKLIGADSAALTRMVEKNM